MGIGAYVCDCFSHHSSGTCDPTKVGREDLGNKTNELIRVAPAELGSQIYQSHAQGWSRCNAYSQNYECWQENIRTKVGGTWISTLKEGMCTSHSTSGNCSWKVSEVSTVNETCLKDSLADAVEGAAAVDGCFSQLGQRNYSSPDWIACFMDTLLGPDASHSTKIAGMQLEDVVTAWKKPFLSEAKGGCPKIPSPASFSSVLV